MDKQHSTFVWKNKHVFDLIRTRVTLDHLFAGKHCGGNSNRWQVVASDVNCGASDLQCKKRWENLQAKYKSIMLPPTGQGLEEKAHPAISWPFFAAMSDFMQGRHTINPLLLIESSVDVVTTAPKIEPSSSCGSSASEPAKNDNKRQATTAHSPSGTSRPSAIELPAQIRSILSTSDGSGDALEKEIIDDPAEQPVAQPVKKRRINTASNNVSELAIAIRDDMEDQRLDRQRARELDSDLLEVLRDFLKKN